MTKIYGTLGPACADEALLEQMLRLGLTGFRLNLSHGSLPQAAGEIEALHGLERLEDHAGRRRDGSRRIRSRGDHGPHRDAHCGQDHPYVERGGRRGEIPCDAAEEGRGLGRSYEGAYRNDL